MDLLNLVTSCNYFALEGKFFSQEDGMPMGSPLSPVFADFFMEEFEQGAIESALFKPKLWLRYVDDTFVVWPHDEEKLDSWLESLNNISESIKLTMEKEVNNKLAFLDVCVEKNNRTLVTSVYRKHTHTGQYLNFNSNHPKHVKIGVAKSLVSRAYKICSTPEALNHEIVHIRDELRTNGYPQSIINNIVRTHKPGNITKTVEDKNPPLTTITIPYVPNISEKIRRITRQYNIRTAFKTNNTLRSHLTKTKPQCDPKEKKNCIYCLDCQCGRQYIGETKRPFNVRLKEHISNVRKGNTKESRIADHAWAEDHRMN